MVSILPGLMAIEAGAELGELGHDVVPGALAEGGQEDHRGDADGHAQGRQGGCAGDGPGGRPMTNPASHTLDLTYLLRQRRHRVEPGGASSRPDAEAHTHHERRARAAATAQTGGAAGKLG